MADKHTYNILDEQEMHKTISETECRNLRKAVSMLTAAPMITKMEYVRFMVVIDGILNRMEKEGQGKWGYLRTE